MTTLCSHRQAQLESLGFVFDPFKVKWEEKYEALCKYRQEVGHSNVPNRHVELGVWIKNQRRQYQLYRLGKKSSMCAERIEKMNRIGFVWKIGNGQDPEPVKLGEEEPQASDLEVSSQCST